ncbi:MAG: hypothetical protein ACRCVT_07875 [Leadbetterella sp.]
MHEIEPFYNWQKYYNSYEDKLGPFYEKINDGHFENTVYEYYIHPDWDDIGSETLYIKILMVNYVRSYSVIELMGEWNDTLHNDIMYLKRYIIDHLVKRNIRKFILVGENILQFHGSDTEYYEEWMEDCEEGWICILGFRDFIIKEFRRYGLDAFFNYGGGLDIENWRTYKPDKLFEIIDSNISKRLS